MTMTKFEDRPEAWNTKENEDFKKGAKLVGVYSDAKEVTTNKGTSFLYTVDIGGGELRAVWGTKKLDSFFKAMPLGIKVELTYNGKIDLAGGNTFHDFDMEYDKEFFEANQAKPDEDKSVDNMPTSEIEDSLKPEGKKE